MQLIFDSASVASFNHKLDYLGENFHYRNTQSISLRGQLLENAFSGVSGIWSQISGAIEDSTDFSEIIINGISFGSGILRSLNFASSNDVRRKDYSAQVDVFSTGNFYNLTGSYYSGLGGLSAFRLDLLESLREDFTFTKSEEGTYEYERSLTMQILGESGVQNAKGIAALIYGQSFLMPFVNAFYPNFYLESGRKFRREVYNLEQGEFSFDESFRFQSENPYIWNYVNTLTFSEEETLVSEEGLFRLVDTSSHDTLNDLFFSGLSGAYDRCNELYSIYATTGCSLINSPAAQRVNKNRFLSEVNYNVTFSDNKSNLTGCIWESTISLERNQNGAYIASENGTIQGQGARTYDPNQQYLNALSCYSGIESGVYGRLSGAYFTTGFFDNCQSGLYLFESSFIDSEYEGLIEYGHAYTTNENFNTSGGIDYKEAVVSVEAPVPLFDVHGILNDKQIVSPTYRGNSSLGVFSNNIMLIGSGDEFSLTNFTNLATGLISLPSGTDGIFLSDLEYTFTPKQRRFSLRVDYNYVDYRELLNILV